MQIRRTGLLALFLVVAGWTTASLAVEPVNTNRKGVAIKGYDPVAYFAEAKAVRGSEKWTHRWNGAIWHFASKENLERFAADPEARAPQYGGYCAWAVSQGYTAGIDPDAWKIVDGKLYLNYSEKIRTRWSKDIPGNIAAADNNWPGLLE